MQSQEMWMQKEELCQINIDKKHPKHKNYVGEQRRFRQACASAQSRQNFRYSFTKYMELEKASDQRPHL